LPKGSKLIRISSRGNGWPGRIELAYELYNKLKIRFISLSEMWEVIPELNISSPLGCLICKDHFAYDADITLGDAWHPKFVERDSLGTSIIIVRSNRGLNLLNESVKEGILHLEEMSLADLL